MFDLWLVAQVRRSSTLAIKYKYENIYDFIRVVQTSQSLQFLFSVSCNMCGPGAAAAGDKRLASDTVNRVL